MPSSWRGNLTHVTAAAKNGVWFAQTMPFYVAWAFVSFLAEYIYNAVGCVLFGRDDAKSGRMVENENHSRSAASTSNIHRRTHGVD
ncbi:hypothetical protein Tco_1292779 [Tanacetum coccineum]